MTAISVLKIANSRRSRSGRGAIGARLAVEGTLHEDQGINRGEHQADRAEHGHLRVSLECAEQNQEFAEKITESRQAERCQNEEQPELRQFGEARPQPAHFGEIAGPEPLVELAAENEEPRGADAMGEDLHDHSLEGLLGAGKDAEHDEAHVADRGVRHQAFGVVLAEGANRAVDDSEHSEPHGDRGELRGRGGEQRQKIAQQAVGGGLQQYSGEDHGSCGRRLGVGVRQPGMKRHDRELRRKAHEQSEHDPEAGARVHRRCQQVRVAERQHPARAVVHEDQRQDGHQHHQARGLGEDEEFERRIEARTSAGDVVAPQRDQEEHRYQHHFPGKEEQEQIRRQKHADDARQSSTARSCRRSRRRSGSPARSRRPPACRAVP